MYGLQRKFVLTDGRESYEFKGHHKDSSAVRRSWPASYTMSQSQSSRELYIGGGFQQELGEQLVNA